MDPKNISWSDFAIIFFLVLAVVLLLYSIFLGTTFSQFPLLLTSALIAISLFILLTAIRNSVPLKTPASELVKKKEQIFSDMRMVLGGEITKSPVTSNLNLSGNYQGIFFSIKEKQELPGGTKEFGFIGVELAMEYDSPIYLKAIDERIPLTRRKNASNQIVWQSEEDRLVHEAENSKKIYLKNRKKISALIDEARPFRIHAQDILIPLSEKTKDQVVNIIQKAADILKN